MKFDLRMIFCSASSASQLSGRGWGGSGLILTCNFSSWYCIFQIKAGHVIPGFDSPLLHINSS